MDQSNRYANLNLKEADLIAGGRHVLCAYVMKPKAGYGYLETAAHFAAESSTGTNVEVSTTDDFTRGVDALVYEIDEAKEITKIAYPVDLFDRNIIDGRAMIASFLTLTIGNNQGMGDVEYGKMYDFYVPPAYLKLFDGPSTTIKDLWRVLGRPVVDGGFIVGTIIKPKLGLRPQPFADACYDFWLGGDFIKNDEPQGNQTFAPFRETVRAVNDAMVRAQDKTGEPKLFSFNITADDYREMIARGEFILETFGPNADHVAFLVDGYVAGPAAITTARRTFPKQYLHYHRAGHGAVTSPNSKRGYTGARARQDGAPAGRIGHPRRHDGLRQDGRRSRRPDHRCDDHRGQRRRRVLPSGMAGHEPDHADHLRRHERAENAGLLRQSRPFEPDHDRRRRRLRPYRRRRGGRDLAAPGGAVLEGGRRSGRVRQGSPRIRARLREFCEGRRRALPGLARQARQGGGLRRRRPSSGPSGHPPRDFARGRLFPRKWEKGFPLPAKRGRVATEGRRVRVCGANQSR